ncbi:MAG: aminotransferase class V-fold PLP-dependent enzyme [Rhodospirillales bacterium]|nr:aminotransferase class V-fold PLP-dependent enzyme [Rhodospirillales bacterium]
MTFRAGWNFLMTPGPTNIPDRVLRAMARPALEYAGPDFMELSIGVHEDLKRIFQTTAEVFIYSANGHGAWEAALCNTLSPGDTVLVPETGQFSNSWSLMAESLGIISQYMPADWRHGVDPAVVEETLRADTGHKIKAVLMVHTDTATAITSDVAAVRKAIDAASHPALFMVDTIASLVTTDYRMDEWGVDVTIAACQKGLMMAPGLSFTAASDKAREVGKSTTMPRNYWNWQTRRGAVHYTWYCGTGPVNSIFGLRESLDMIFEETLLGAQARHQRLADAVRAAVGAWDSAGSFELNALVSDQRANGVTTILIDEAMKVSELHTLCRDKFNVSLGYGLGKLKGKCFRIGHMGHVNEPMVLGALGSVEAAFAMLGIKHGKGGVQAAVDSLAQAC